ncbi:MAG TPA: HEAT repeat domain-containing protein, partial [Gaiellales bacterium]
MRRRERADPTARLRRVRALPPTPAALPELIRALADPSTDIVSAALTALAHIGGAAEAEHLRGMLLTVDLGLVPDVAATLRTLGDRAAVPAAVAGLADSSLGTRMAAATVLGVLGDPAAVAPLAAALADPIAGVRRCALTALAQIGPAPDVEAACAPL